MCGYDIQANGESVHIYSCTCTALLALTVINTAGISLSIGKHLRKRLSTVSDEYAIIELSQLYSAQCEYVTSIEPNKKLFHAVGYELGVVEMRLMSADHHTFLAADDYVAAADAICCAIKSGMCLIANVQFLVFL